MANTYEAIATQTLGSAAASVTFSSIPSTYTDLVLVVAGAVSSISGTRLRFNGDSASNYSQTFLYGTGSVAGSVRGSGTQISTGTLTTSQSVCRVNVMNYANSTTFKTTLSRTDAADDSTSAVVGLWRSTAAITSINIQSDPSTTFNTGSTFSLYGIKNSA